MLPANVMGVGMHICPGIEATPVGVPTPCVNMGLHVMAVPPCPTILLTCQPALNIGSIVPAGPNVPPLIPPVFLSMNVAPIPTILLQCLPATSLALPAVSSGPPGLTGSPDVNIVFFMYAQPVGDEAAAAGTTATRRRVTIEDLRAFQQSLSGSMVESKMVAAGVGYVSIRRFSSRVPSEVFSAVRDLTARGMTSLVIDLRGNPGGEMGAFLQLTGDFLEDGQPIVTMIDPEDDETEYRAQGAGPYRFPVAVLVDARTASAAEVFAGCLQAHGRAVVVGERTYGKGVAQAFVPSLEGLTYATVASYTLPDGRSVDGVGVESNVPSPSQDPAGWIAGSHVLSPALRDAIARVG